MADAKLRVLIVGGTGYLGKWLVEASLALGHATFVLFRPGVVSDISKCQALMQFKMKGAQLLRGSLEDDDSLVSALKQVDVVVSAIAGHKILQQLKLVDAIKQVDNIKRFVPSEFGMDVDRMRNALPPGDEIFNAKRIVRRAIEEANIPYTYVSANCLASFFLAGLAQLGLFLPPRDHVNIYGAGDKKCIWVAEEDVAMYTMLTISDPRTVNKVLYLRPPENILSQMEVVRMWEELIGAELNKTFISEKEWLAKIDAETAPFLKAAKQHFYDTFYLGQLHFDVEGTGGLDCSELYREYKYVTAEDYLKRFV
ncbi:bifunctional pinoresinol-lariciresinol reductase 2-like [Canna indica]|uniref:Bifunctional pinoresinol-lariciresinol reductase 2-like n=1 Tax=Canna indica TaxID=4628 RepID=A0AAQ3L4L0_9LILI|nr:bifunctional pinoresinol-lariciresinol reductase 2-like [Canna indica]